jgi:uncharacterized protein YbjT (DUF2867 family)
MTEKTATVIGSTGLIGSNLVEILCSDNDYKFIRVIVRRPVTFDSPKVQVRIVDFSDNESFKGAVAESDAVFCAVGTTQKKVKGDKVEYRKVDHDIPVNAARFCAETGCQSFLLVSSVGADSKSSNFYLKLKGEVEDAVSKMKIPSVSIFRPSILLGERNESRTGESIGKVFSSTFSFLIPSKYKPVQAREVARAMVAASKLERPGVNVYHYEEMRKL